jgi:predicted GIY-YIG superfamily endonuclease
MGNVPVVLDVRDRIFVYVLKAGPFVKIGYSKDIQSRITALKTGSQYPVTLAYSRSYDNRAAAMAAEKMLHKVWAEHRYNGEWFIASRKMDFYFNYTLSFYLHEPIIIKDEFTQELGRVRQQKIEKEKRHEQTYQDFLDLIEWSSMPGMFGDEVRNAIKTYSYSEIMERATYLKYFIDATYPGEKKMLNYTSLKKILRGEKVKPHTVAIRSMFKKIWREMSKSKAANLCKKLNLLDDEVLDAMAANFHLDYDEDEWNERDMTAWFNQACENHGIR